MNDSKTRICVYGLGEAGGLISADLVAAGNVVAGYDPKPVATPPRVSRFDDPSSAVADADVVVALTAAADAPRALEQAFDTIPDSALYADFSTASAALKQQLAGRCAARGIQFADVAIMAIVPGKGIRVPTLVSGSGARRFVDLFETFGMSSQVVSAVAGDAAARKLVRSVMMKGLASAAIEAMQAAEAVGCADWLWQNMSAELVNADDRTLRRLVRGTHLHGPRRIHEMEAATELLQSLGIEPIMTGAIAENLRNLVRSWPAAAPDAADDGRKLPDWWPEA